MALKSLTTEQVLLIAEEVCAQTNAEITNYAALSTIASITNPRIYGVPVYLSATERDKELRRLITSYPPLNSHNLLLCDLIQAVLVSRETPD